MSCGSKAERVLGNCTGAGAAASALPPALRFEGPAASGVLASDGPARVRPVPLSRRPALLGPASAPSCVSDARRFRFRALPRGALPGPRRRGGPESYSHAADRFVQCMHEGLLPSHFNLRPSPNIFLRCHSGNVMRGTNLCRTCRPSGFDAACVVCTRCRILRPDGMWRSMAAFVKEQRPKCNQEDVLELPWGQKVKKVVCLG